jgi:hypothetical protein
MCSLPPAWGLGEGLTTPHRKEHLDMKYYTGHEWRVLVKTAIKLQVQ